ncbi:Translation machinery-associated protein 22 [Tilletia horrida]|uniref:Translation machinery-associated protein 22 n=1 Tax=Tilletia horrida TaxID=155126 RepID=A0AAN6GEC2_9BASI|nr:Translation machinery-associated protein 22 [Tilletia horrida]KAK0538371.1 Translation machinery-associated protein 22 [Tilletia horrida]KAK0540412.1 Translation machinery-associated protein 22 [Tilletia horrida]KAK0565024.1 Translation machinery-associated protein 22 [Tilletia horrida]
MADTTATTSTAGEGPQAPAPKEVLYCGVCTWPVEYCEFGSSASKCRSWLEQNHQDVYGTIWSEEAIQKGLENLSTKQAEDLKKDVEKKERKAEAKAERDRAQRAGSRIVLTRTQRTKRKATTSIFGLHHFQPPLPALKVVAKGLSSRLATGASVHKSTQNPQIDEIVIQGDVADEVRRMILERTKPFNELPAGQGEGGVSEKNVIIEEAKKKKDDAADKDGEGGDDD